MYQKQFICTSSLILHRSAISVKGRNITIKLLSVLWVCVLVHILLKRLKSFDSFCAVRTHYAPAVAWLMFLSPIHPHIYTDTHTLMKKCCCFLLLTLSPCYFSNAHVLPLPWKYRAHRYTHTYNTHTWVYVRFNVFIVCGGHHILCLL